MAGEVRGLADLHMHSEFSDGMHSIPEILEYVEHETDLDLIAITDHDNIEGALLARDLVAKGKYRFEVIVGIEISTIGGHLLAYDIEHPIKGLQTLSKSIRLVHEQGGWVVAPHPMSWLTRSIGYRDLISIMKNVDPLIYFDGIEIINPSLAGRVVYDKIVRVNRDMVHLPETAGSDAHFLHHIGTAHTSFEGKTADNFRQSLKAKTTQPHGSFWTLEDHRKLGRKAGQQMIRSMILMPARYLTGQSGPKRK
ncbi:MAG: PHP domain-containing protein [Chloroflexi bacterium]|nr:PHP domain-containing protein [Chloroflexota bacterium]